MDKEEVGYLGKNKVYPESKLFLSLGNKDEKNNLSPGKFHFGRKGGLRHGGKVGSKGKMQSG